jgi:hypothetical protein
MVIKNLGRHSVLGQRRRRRVAALRLTALLPRLSFIITHTQPSMPPMRASASLVCGDRSETAASIAIRVRSGSTSLAGSRLGSRDGEGRGEGGAGTDGWGEVRESVGQGKRCAGEEGGDLGRGDGGVAVREGKGLGETRE